MQASLLDKSHRPYSKHPNAHTDEELKWIQDYHRRNPKISVCELYGKLRTAKGYFRHPGSLYRIYRNLGYSSSAPSTKNRRKPKPYDTPSQLGIKWQMDVKYVPTACYSGFVSQKFYQYTVIDEAARERFIFPYMEQSSYSTVDFLKRAILYFGYQPEILQTDNGTEFTHIQKTDRMYPLDILCHILQLYDLCQTADYDNYSVKGLPFYTHNVKEQRFKQYFEKLYKKSNFQKTASILQTQKMGSRINTGFPLFLGYSNSSPDTLYWLYIVLSNLNIVVEFHSFYVILFFLKVFATKLQPLLFSRLFCHQTLCMLFSRR